MVGSIVNELNTLLHNAFVWYGMLVHLVRTFNLHTILAPSQKTRTVHKRTILFNKN